MCLGYRPDDLEGLKALCKTTNPNICTRFAGVNNKVIDIIRYLSTNTNYAVGPNQGHETNPNKNTNSKTH